MVTWEQLGYDIASPGLGVLLCGAAAGGWFAYFRLKERVAKPFGFTLAALLGGSAAAVLALTTFNSLEHLGITLEWCDLQAGDRHGLEMALLLAAVEEGAKVLPTLFVTLAARKHLLRSREALLVAALSGVGFAVAENMFLCQQGMSVLDSVARAIAAPVTHALFAAPAGLGVGRLVMRRKGLELPLGLAASVVAHALYNLLLALEVPQVVPATLVLGLWVWLLTCLAPTGLAPRAEGDPS